MNKLDVEAPPGEDISRILEDRRKSWMKSKKFEDQLESDKIQADVLKEVIKESQEDEHQASRFQEFLDRILQYTPLQVVLLVLAIIDVAVVVSEILVTLHVYDIERSDSNSALKRVINFIKRTLHLEGNFYLENVISVLNQTLQSCDFNRTTAMSLDVENADHGLAQRMLSPKLFYNPFMIARPAKLLRIKRGLVESDIPDNGLPENDAIEQLHIVEQALNITSIIILGIFLVVAIMKIIAEGRHFFTQIMEVIDTIVVTLSFILDIVKYTGALNKDATEATIVILLLWQIVRMFNGIMLSELKRLEFRIKLLKRARKKVESKLSTTTNKMKIFEKEIDRLKKLSRDKGALEEEIASCRPSAIKTSTLAGLSCIASMSVGLSISTPLAVDLKEQRHHLLQSLSTKVSGGSFTSTPSEIGGVSLVAMFPSEDGSSNAVETEESTADAEPSSPSKKVTFVTNDDDDDDIDNNNNNDDDNGDDDDNNNDNSVDIDIEDDDDDNNNDDRQDNIDYNDRFVNQKSQTKHINLPQTET